MMLALQKPDDRTVHLVGFFDLLPEDLTPDTHFGLCARPVDLVAHWKRCGLLANFVARYFSVDNAQINGEVLDQEGRIYNMISQSLNEFVENAAKYTSASLSTIEMEMRYFAKAPMNGEAHRILRVDVLNEADIANTEKLVEWSAEIFETDDLDTLYLQHVEAHAEGGYDGSLLGLIMLIKDYPLKVGFKVLEGPDGKRKVISRAYFILDEMAA